MSAPAARRLTLAQWRILDESLVIPGRAYNGRSRQAIDALEAAGLVTTTREIDQTKGASLRITVTPIVPAVRAYLVAVGLLREDEL